MSETIHFAPTADYSGPKRALILAGGGMRLAYQAGVLRALEEARLVFAHADGTSGGIMNLAMLLSRLSPDEMCHRWRGLKVKDFVSFLSLREYLNPFKLRAFGDADGVINKVFPQLGIDMEKIRAAQGMEGTFNVCNFSDKTNRAVSHREVTLGHLVAGMSLPIFMPAVKMGEDWYSDSVWIKDANLWQAVKMGAEEIWLVWAIGNSRTYRPGSFYQYVHMIEMSANGCLFEELDRINDLNERIARDDSPYGQKQPISLHVIKPEYPLPLDPDYYFNRIDAASLIDMGYADAKCYLQHQQTVPLLPSATQMREDEYYLLARQKWIGAVSGLFQGYAVSLHLTLPVHGQQDYCQAGLSFPTVGHLDLGGEEVIPLGQIQLAFKTNGDRKLSAIECNARFEHQGKGYQLSALGTERNFLGRTSELQIKILERGGGNALATGNLRKGTGLVSTWFNTHVIQAPSLVDGIKTKCRLWKLLALGLI